ncbi:hypothetical protein PR048_003209 [Dryococelus australis]|uniref:Uncharacterized protein n=1 Tax=Dryococelus australis TaxID=614101 RepID=A0ABQ9IME2_9NEOP|nr:hypothetical protein PR048_003209 [Dryococelus australis]
MWVVRYSGQNTNSASFMKLQSLYVDAFAGSSFLSPLEQHCRCRRLYEVTDALDQSVSFGALPFCKTSENLVIYSTDATHVLQVNRRKLALSISEKLVAGKAIARQFTVFKCRRGRGGWAARLLASHQGEPGSIPGRVTPDFRNWESCRAIPLVGGVFSWISRSPHPCIPASLHSHFNSSSSALITSLLKSRPNPRIKDLEVLKTDGRTDGQTDTQRPSPSLLLLLSLVDVYVPFFCFSMRFLSQHEWQCLPFPCRGCSDAFLWRFPSLHVSVTLPYPPVTRWPWRGFRLALSPRQSQSGARPVPGFRCFDLGHKWPIAGPQVACQQLADNMWFTHGRPEAESQWATAATHYPLMVLTCLGYSWLGRSGPLVVQMWPTARGIITGPPVLLPCIPAPLHTRFTLIGSQDLTVKNRPNLSTLLSVYRVIQPTVTERLVCSLPTKANRVQYLTESLPDFRTRESCRTMPLVAGFSRGCPVSPRPLIPELLHTDLASPSSVLKISPTRRLNCVAECFKCTLFHEAISEFC